MLTLLPQTRKKVNKNHKKSSNKKITKTMKVFKIILLLFAFIIPGTVVAQSRLFSDLSEDKNVKTVYISKTMLKLATGLVGSSVESLGDGTVNIGKVLDNVNSIEIVSTEKKKTVKKIQKLLNKATKTYDLQPLIDTPNSDENKQILCQTDDYTGLVTKLLLVEKQKNQMKIIVVQGAINVADLLSK
jgi:hypothetical protein